MNAVTGWPRAGSGLRFPVPPVVATGIAVVAGAGHYVVPGMIPALQRAPGGLPDGR